MFPIEAKDGVPGKITKLQPSRPLKFPDGLRSTGNQTFIMAEGGGSVDRVAVNDDADEIDTIKNGIAGPTSVALAGETYGRRKVSFRTSRGGEERDRRRTHEQVTVSKKGVSRCGQK